MKALLATCGSWRLPVTAKAFEARDALAAYWTTERNRAGISAGRFRRCWPFHLAMTPFYRYSPQIVVEKAFYALSPIWRMWLARQAWPQCDVVHSMMGFATEPFNWADKVGALKVVDCPNSHPTSYRGYWQRECDIYCPGEKVPIPQWMFARMNRELERADVVLCTSTFVRDTMITNGIPAAKCFLNPTGVDVNVFKPRTAVPSNPRFVAVGTICLRKGHQYLFRAFEQVKRELPNAELLCVGPDKCDFRKERPKWAGLYQHYPQLSHPELAKLLQTATAMVLTSVEEGFARVVVEAMAAGLPIVATYETGATTLVQDGVEGIIVPARNPAQTAQAMLRLARELDLCRRMGHAAYQKVGKSNTWQHYADRLLAEYQSRLEPWAGAKRL
jgi:glycosyltransferase involved in cell wall biosynthesis